MPTQAKTETVEGLKARLSDVKTVVLTEYRGLTVQQLSDLRRQLRSAGAQYKVVKNRLARLAVRSSHLAGLAPHLAGPMGLVLSKQDPVAVAKALQTFARGSPLLLIKLGYVEGRILEATEVRSMADLPSRELLLAQVVGGLGAPLGQLVYALDGLLRSLVSLLNQVREKKGAPAE